MIKETLKTMANNNATEEANHRVELCKGFLHIINIMWDNKHNMITCGVKIIIRGSENNK